MRRLVRALPALATATVRLASDPALPEAAKVALALAALYLLSPIDLLPDVIPLAGWLDDLLIVAVVLDGVLGMVDRAVLLRYWPGTPRSLDQVARAARLLAAWVPRRLRRRLVPSKG
jgi:uncharacterized membrane protein YkvA (DUF1232 family)